MRLVPALAALLLLGGCATYTLRHDYDPKTDFRAYRTFEWYASSHRAKGQRNEGSPIMDRRVQAAVEARLVSKGYMAVSVGKEPDFLVTYYPIYRDRKIRTATTVGTTVGFAGGRYGRRRWGYGAGSRFTAVHHYTEGTLVLEIVDGRSDQLVWQGAAVGALSNLDGPEEATEQVGKAVADLLETFPPR